MRVGRFICHVSMLDGLEPGIDRHQRDEAAQQEAGADGERHGERDFGDDQRGARAAAETAADVAAAVFLQRAHAARARSAESAGSSATSMPVTIETPSVIQHHARVGR